MNESPNVIMCPKCKKDIGLEEAEIKPAKKENEFVITCKLCDHTWQAHARHFRKRGDPPRNPFAPIRIPGVG
ncbi:MAG: hypothetical protein M1429_04200 [Patescibacteria group bacterium]|nr:hypothetical protein [Patescibacteria group bacterium]